MNENAKKFVELVSEPVKQRAFWKQIQADVSKGVKNKVIELSTAEILALIRDQKILCSFCGKKISFRMPMTTEELAIFLTFIINPLSGMTCNECYEECARKGCIIAQIPNLIHDTSEQSTENMEN